MGTWRSIRAYGRVKPRLTGFVSRSKESSPDDREAGLKIRFFRLHKVPRDRVDTGKLSFSAGIL
jgi:hypothetical protein